MPRSLKVLHIEDSRVFAEAVSAVIRLRTSLKIELVNVETLMRATELMHQQYFDLVLLDLSLPDSCGLATFETFKSQFPTMPVIIFSADEDDDMSEQAMQMGAQDYIHKSDLDGKLLSRSIHHAIERSKLIAHREEFIAALVHDIKNPLIGNDRILQSIIEHRFGKIEPQLEEVANMMVSSNRALLELLKNLLDMHHYDGPVPRLFIEPVNLSSLLNNSLNDVRPLLTVKQLNISSELDDGIRACADRTAMQRVFLNLLGNSIKFTPSGGSIFVGSERTNTGALIKIEDSGDGIPEDEQNLLFQRYSQGRSERQHMSGSGLGLYVCQKIVQAHNGRISCESKPNLGTKFLIELPLSTVA